jgi:putative nucleotidyltransferase with HDIG domain
MLARLLYRFKQFWFAVASGMTIDDRNFARQYLNLKEAALFFSLPGFEQKHAVVVAGKMREGGKGVRGVEERKLIRLGLLHDVGKAAERLSIIDKSVLVIAHRFLPKLYDGLAKRGEADKSASFYRKFYVHKHHGTIGAELLSKIGESTDIIAEVKSHDRPFSSHDIYMRLLDFADSTY